MFLVFYFLSAFALAGPQNQVWEKAKVISSIEREEVAAENLWIQGVRYLLQSSGETPDKLDFPRYFSLFEKLPAKEQTKLKSQYPSLKYLLRLLDQKRYLQRRETKRKTRLELNKLISELQLDLPKMIRELHNSSAPLDSYLIDELMGFEYDSVESTLPDSYPLEAWVNQPKELSQTEYETIRKILLSAPPKVNDVVYDLGSGYGRFVLYGAIMFPKTKFKGIELVKERVEVSKHIANKMSLTNATFVAQDVLKSNFNDGSYFYVFNSFPSLEQRVIEELRKVATKRKITIICLGNIYKSLLQTNWVKQKVLLDQWQQLAVFESK